MKKQTAMTLAAIVFALSLTSCTGTVTGTGTGNGTEQDPAGTTYIYDSDDNRPDGYFYQGNPDYDYHEVLMFEELPDYELESFDVPWGEQHDLRMVNGPIKNYFCYYTFDENDEVNNECLNTVSTISRPRVRVFPSDKEGYVMYEVQYTQTFPIVSKGKYSSYRTNMYSYYGVNYLDYYTGTMLPYLNAVYNHTASCGVAQTFIREGKSDNYEFYQFKEYQDESEGSEDAGDGYCITRRTISVTRTDYIVVPEHYDGLLLYVYVGDWVSEPRTEEEAEANPNQDPLDIHYPEPFDDEENLDDYVFFGIKGPK